MLEQMDIKKDFRFANRTQMAYKTVNTPLSCALLPYTRAHTQREKTSCRAQRKLAVLSAAHPINAGKRIVVVMAAVLFVGLLREVVVDQE